MPRAARLRAAPAARHPARPLAITGAVVQWNYDEASGGPAGAWTSDGSC